MFSNRAQDLEADFELGVTLPNFEKVICIIWVKLSRCSELERPLISLILELQWRVWKVDLLWLTASVDNLTNPLFSCPYLKGQWQKRAWAMTNGVVSNATISMLSQTTLVRTLHLIHPRVLSGETAHSKKHRFSDAVKPSNKTGFQAKSLLFQRIV